MSPLTRNGPSFRASSITKIQTPKLNKMNDKPEIHVVVRPVESPSLYRRASRSVAFSW